MVVFLKYESETVPLSWLSCGVLRWPLAIAELLPRWSPPEAFAVETGAGIEDLSQTSLWARQFTLHNPHHQVGDPSVSLADMAKASAHDAQCAADAHLNPNPPILIGRVAILRAKFCSSTSPADLFKKEMPSSWSCAYLPDRLGGSVHNVWLARGLALCNNNCHAHRRFFTVGIASQKRATVQ